MIRAALARGPGKGCNFLWGCDVEVVVVVVIVVVVVAVVVVGWWQ